MFQYPNTDLDRLTALMSVLGSFWTNVYTRDDQPEQLMRGQAQLHVQTYLDLLELIGVTGRHSTPIWHKDNWFFLPIRESLRNQGESGLLKYDAATGETYDLASGNSYGISFFRVTSNWAVPAELVDASLIMNRLTSPSRVLVKDVDFRLEAGQLQLQANPFDDPLYLKKEIVVENEMIDQEIGLWVFRGDFDWKYAYEQWGYVLQLELASSQAYLDYVNIILDAFVEGTTVRHLHQALSLLTGIPLVREAAETVEVILQDDVIQQVITDRQVYTFSPRATITTEIGDIVREGDSLVSDLIFHDFNRGVLPNPSIVSQLALGRDFVAEGYFADIIWENRLVDLIVESTPEGDKISWEMPGWPGDAERFFEEIHTRGAAAGKLLSAWLNESIPGVPRSDIYPAQINPLALLVQNLFRKFAVLVTINTAGIGNQALGLHAGRILRKLIPPQTALIIQIRLVYEEGPITMGPDDDIFGALEARQIFLGQQLTDRIDSRRIAENVNTRQVAGSCR